MSNILGRARRLGRVSWTPLAILGALWLGWRISHRDVGLPLPALSELFLFCTGLAIAWALPFGARRNSVAIEARQSADSAVNAHQQALGAGPNHAPLPQGTRALLAILARALGTAEVALFVRQGASLICRAQEPHPFADDALTQALRPHIEPLSDGDAAAGDGAAALGDGRPAYTIAAVPLGHSPHQAVVPLYPSHFNYDGAYPNRAPAVAPMPWALLLAQRREQVLQAADLALVTSVAEQIAVSLRLEQALRDAQADRLRLEHMATTDALTELANRRHFMRIFALQLARAKRYHRRLSLIFLDIDHFKQVNDTFGHAMGDEVLRGVARVLRTTARGTDTVARYGGEEFAILMEETGPSGAHRIAERIREALAKEHFGPEDASFCKTVSVGVATFPEHGDEPEHLIACADDALYQAKRQGRDRITLYRGPTSPSQSEPS